MLLFRLQKSINEFVWREVYDKMDINPNELGEFVEYLRKEKGLSMRQVAELKD